MAGSAYVRGNAQEVDHLLGGLDYHSVWSSPEAFGRHIKKQDCDAGWMSDAWDKGNKAWTGTETMEEAQDLASGNWKEGAEKVRLLVNRINATHPVGPRLIKYGIAGVLPNVPRAVAGNILNMRQSDTARSRKKPILTLMCNMSANCGVHADSITNRAAAVAAIVDQIEAKGYAVEVISTALTGTSNRMGDGNFKAATSIIAKESHQPTDIIRLAFALGHVSMFRRLVFADWQSDNKCSKLGPSLGYVNGFKAVDTSEWKDKAVYKVPSCEDRAADFKDEEAVMTSGLDYLMEELHKQGCPAFAERTWKEPEKNVLPQSIFGSDDF